MNKRIWLISCVLAAVMLLSSCNMRTVSQMYAVPKRSEEFQQLQAAIDRAMEGLRYSAPIAGENRQTVQQADLDGDGVKEYLLFAYGGAELPLNIFVFQEKSGEYVQTGRIQSNGSAFEQVEYVDIDGKPGMEIVVGSQLSDQVLRSAAVYSFSDGQTRQLMSTQYSKFLTCDLNQNGTSELMVIAPGSSETDKAFAALYTFTEGAMERSAEVGLSRSVEDIKRIMVSRLDGGAPAVYVASSVDESAIVTDVFAMKDGRFTNISFSNESGTGVNTLRNYYVYADDIDDDGILELPGLITMKEVDGSAGAKQHLIRWFAMDIAGGEVDKLHTFHNFLGGWYLMLDGDWAQRVSVTQTANAYTFYLWDEGQTEHQKLLTLYVLSGENREEEAVIENRVVLHRTESVVYTAKLDAASASYGITQDSIINCFHLIHQDWYTGET